MKVRLKKDAPWDSVISPTGQTVSKTQWVDEQTDIRPFAKYIEYLLDETDVDYDIDIEQLILAAENNNVQISQCKEELIKRLKNAFVKMPKVNKINYSELSKNDLISIAENNGIVTKGLSKSKLIELLENV